jgi:glycopeptide antibiotics resistance protein
MVMMGFMIRSEQALVEGTLLWIIIRSMVQVSSKRYKRVSFQREFLLNIFVFYLIALISVTIFPIDVVWGESARRVRPVFNIIPFVDIITDFPRSQFSLAFKIRFLIRNIGGNLLLLLPLGIFLPSMWVKMRSFLKTVIMGALTSLIIELLQYALAYLGYGWGRATDIDDLILNTLGVMIGYLIFDKILARFDLPLQLRKSSIVK